MDATWRVLFASAQRSVANIAPHCLQAPTRGKVLDKRLDLNDVRIFVIAARTATLSGAARELGLSTSTVSRSITRLERYLGLLLINRGQRGVVLTDAGIEYVGSCKQALQTLKDGGELLDSHRVHPGGLLRVACPITMARGFLAPVLMTFLNSNPELQVEIDPYCSGFDKEPNENVDVHFKVREPNDSRRHVRHYPATKLALYASRDYVSAFGVVKEPDDLQEHRCIGAGSNSHYAKWKLRKGEKSVILDLRFQVMATDPEVHRRLVLDGAGVAMLPIWMANNPAIAGKLVPVLPGWRPDSLPLCALYSGTSGMTPKVKAFLDFVTEYLGTDRDPRVTGGAAYECFEKSQRQAIHACNHQIGLWDLQAADSSLETDALRVFQQLGPVLWSKFLRSPHKLRLLLCIELRWTCRPSSDRSSHLFEKVLLTRGRADTKQPNRLRRGVVKLVRSIRGDIHRIACSHSRRFASKSNLYLTFQKDECLLEVVTVCSWTAVGRNMHVNHTKAADGIVPA